MISADRIAECASLINSTDNVDAIRALWFIAAGEGLGIQVGVAAAQRLLDIQDSTFTKFSEDIESWITPIGAIATLRVARDCITEGSITLDQYKQLADQYTARPDSISDFYSTHPIEEHF